MGRMKSKYPAGVWVIVGEIPPIGLIVVTSVEQRSVAIEGNHQVRTECMSPVR
jgi:hypothetical protein